MEHGVAFAVHVDKSGSLHHKQLVNVPCSTSCLPVLAAIAKADRT